MAIFAARHMDVSHYTETLLVQASMGPFSVAISEQDKSNIAFEEIETRYFVECSIKEDEEMDH